MYKLRVDIFVHEQHCSYSEIDDLDASPDTFHIRALRNDSGVRQLLGTARLFPTTIEGEEVVQIGRVCLTPAERGTGLSVELMEQTLRLAREQAPGRDVVLNAQIPLVPFYQGLGFEPAGEIFDEEGVDHQPMRRQS